METTDVHNDGLAVAVRDLRKSYGEMEAVRGVSFEVASGEVFCLLGPNGAGKTTTVEILEGYRLRDDGEVRVLGIDPASESRKLREQVGIVLQQCGVQNDLTVAELIEMYGRYYSRRRPVDELIELVDLGEKRDVRAKNLSGGQLRRLDLALALVGDPDVVFLDEPTTGFDPAARRTAWNAVRRLKELGKTVVLTTHYLEEAQALSDRVAIMKSGRLVAEGPPAELDPGRARYRVSYVSSGRRVEHQTDDPTELLHRLTRDAIARGERLEGLEVTRPTLEEIYLELTAEADSA